MFSIHRRLPKVGFGAHGLLLWDPSQYEPLQVKGFRVYSVRGLGRTSCRQSYSGFRVQYGFEGLRLEEKRMCGFAVFPREASHPLNLGFRVSGFGLGQ